MITLTLLSPHNLNLTQKWQFRSQSVIRIGRSQSNDVILYSAVVSRHHATLQNNGFGWELVSLGVNGIYLNGKKVTHTQVENGMVVSLGDSGPKLRIHITSDHAHDIEEDRVRETPTFRRDRLNKAQHTFIASFSRYGY